MQTYIEAIILLNEEGEKRHIDFKAGVNIITGESKTGKSALVEIIDYCLCSSRCTIPKGKITDFAALYAVIIVIDKKRYIIARKAIISERKRMYFSRIEDEISSENINQDFFEDKIFYDYKNVQKQIEKVIGLNVSNFKEDVETIKECASLRHMTSYMFQHQNLMASKFALFYRFDDYQKKKDVILQFPIFSGIVGQEYYSTLMLLNDYKKEHKRLKNSQVSNEKIKESIRSKLLSKFKDYYALVGRELDEKTPLETLVKLGENLPGVSEESYTLNKMKERYDELNNELDVLREKEIAIKDKISKLDKANEESQYYIQSLDILEAKAKVATPINNEFICPLCGNDCKEIQEIAKEMEIATMWLETEAETIAIATEQFSEEKRKLIHKKDEIVRQIKNIWAQKRKIEKNYLNQETLKLQDQINFSKAEIKVHIETIEEGLFEVLDEELKTLEDKIARCKEKIEEFNLETEMHNAQRYINDNMNKLKRKLDFEEEFKKYFLYFDLQEFELSLRGNCGEKVTLSEMGSGANWVSCHIALFLSLLHYFASRKSKASIPLILFFDQPSQVYFPQDILSNEIQSSSSLEKDKEAVSSMYEIIFEEIEEISKIFEVDIQLIVVDHVDENTMQKDKEKESFKNYTRGNWRDGIALI